MTRGKEEFDKMVQETQERYGQAVKVVSELTVEEVIKEAAMAQVLEDELEDVRDGFDEMKRQQTFLLEENRQLSIRAKAQKEKADLAFKFLEKRNEECDYWMCRADEWEDRARHYELILEKVWEEFKVMYHDLMIPEELEKVLALEPLEKKFVYNEEPWET